METIRRSRAGIAQFALIALVVILMIVAAGAGFLVSSTQTVTSTLTTTETTTQTPTAPTVTTTFTLVQDELSNGAIQSDVNATSACAMWQTYNSTQTGSAFGVLLSTIQSNPKYVTLEGNRSGYTYVGGGCGTPGLEVVFGYLDRLHPFKVCGNSTTWPGYQIIVQVDLTTNGYDLNSSNYTSVYDSPQNTTVLCTTSISVTSSR